MVQTVNGKDELENYEEKEAQSNGKDVEEDKKCGW